MTEATIDRQIAGSTRLPAYSLMFGNFITGLAVLAPAGMLAELANGLSVTIRDAGLLVTFGAIVLCIGSPLMAWMTTALDRRLLLVGSLAVIAAGHAASALAPNYATLLGVRLAMLAVAAIFTPQAASTIALIVPERERSSAISFVFLGWSIAAAVGLPLITFISDSMGWRTTYAIIAVAATLAALLHVVAIPAGLRGQPLSLRSWGAIARNPLIILLLAITAAWVSGMFTIFPYLGPLLKELAAASPTVTGAFFGIFGTAGFIGNVIATRIVARFGAFNTSLVFLLSLLLGAIVWTFGEGSLVTMGAGAIFLGLGFAALNSMQQARLVAVVPALASATVALNTSLLYVGQAIGSGLGGILFSHELLRSMGFVSAAFMLLALALLLVSKPSSAKTAG
ncbi:MAG: MFS transporter [Xanthobacteraceae bacterium]